MEILWKGTVSTWQIAQNYSETMPFHKISTPGNHVKLWYFLQCSVCYKVLEVCLTISGHYALKDWILGASIFPSCIAQKIMKFLGIF